MHSLDRHAGRVHAGDYGPEALGAWRESRHIRTLRITPLERQINQLPKFAGDKRAADFGERSLIFKVATFSTPAVGTARELVLSADAN